MQVSRRVPALLVLVAATALGGSASAEPIAPIARAKIEPIHAPAAPSIKPIKPIKPARAPSIKPAAGPGVPHAEHDADRSLNVTRKATAAPPAPTVVRIHDPRNADPGLHVEVDDATGRVVLRGVAEGPLVKRLLPYNDHVVHRGVSFELDRDRMPDFSGEPNYTATNRWYFSHLAETSTRAGEPALSVAQRLAESLSKGGVYAVKVSEGKDGSAVIDLERR